MAKNVDHTHGDTGEKPAQDLNFQTGGFPDPEVFDWFWTEVPAAINDHANTIEAIDANEDGVVDEAAYAQDTDSFKGNDLDTDGDGKVDAAETADSAKTADTVKGNDLDSDGDGKVDSAESADTAAGLTNVSHSELADAPPSAHHTQYSDPEARSAVDNSSVTVKTALSVETRTSDPSNPETGRVWLRTDL